MNDSKNRALILAIIEGGLYTSETATRFNVSTRRIRTLVTSYRSHGLAGIDTRSRRPHTNPRANIDAMTTTILELRDTLNAEGLDADPESIHDKLPTPPGHPSQRFGTPSGLLKVQVLPHASQTLSALAKQWLRVQ